MRRAMGPIVTTAVALMVAGAVVANPNTPSHSDVRIPAVQLSSSSDGSGMLDAAFLAAIAPTPPDSTNPLSVFRELISSIAADVADFGRTAIVDAFVAGVTAAYQPNLTATWIPYSDAYSDPNSEPAASDLPMFFGPAAAMPNGGASPDAASSADMAVDLSSLVVQKVAAGLTATAAAVGAELMVAAHAAGAVVAMEPQLILDTLRALVAGDIGAALQNAVKAVAIPFGSPGMILLGVVRGLMAKYFPARVQPDLPQPKVTAIARTAPPILTPRVAPDRRGLPSDPAPMARPGPLVHTTAAIVGDPTVSGPLNTHVRHPAQPHRAESAVSGHRSNGLRNSASRNSANSR